MRCRLCGMRKGAAHKMSCFVSKYGAQEVWCTDAQWDAMVADDDVMLYGVWNASDSSNSDCS